MSRDALPAGFFGKLASHGDFVSRRLAPAFVDRWDAWLQAGLAYSRARLDGQWQSTYLCSPLWHFALAANVCGPRGCAGVLMPSVDRVGRYFPLTLAQDGLDGSPLDYLNHAGAWYAELARLALSSLEEEFSLDLFDNALCKLEMPPGLMGREDCKGYGRGVGEPLWLELPARTPRTEAVAAWSDQIAAYLGREGMSGHSMFWREGLSHLSPALLLCEGLPSVTMFVDLLTGRAADRYLSFNRT